MGQRGSDVIMAPEVRSLFPFTIEAKNCKRWSVLEWIEQAKANCYPETDWLLVLKRSGRRKDERTEEVVVLDAKVFFALLERLNAK